MKKLLFKDVLAKNMNLIRNEVIDGVFIMFHSLADNYIRAVKPDQWTNHQNSGEIAEGVMIAEGEKILVVAPTEATLYWSSNNINGGGTTTTDFLTAQHDWNGKSNTAAQIKHPECSGVDYAPGFCAAYERVNANGKGLTAGRWWLPSLGELMMIRVNMNKINYALSFIEGSTPIAKDWYQTSTEYDNKFVWSLHLNTFNFYNHPSKKESNIRTRPVSNFIN